MASILFWRLSSEDQAKLMIYEWDNFGVLLSIPAPPDMLKAEWDAVLDGGLEAIARFMEQKPHKPRQVS